MLEQLKTPFKKVYGKVRSRADGFVGPVKESASKLLALFPNIRAFAGSEELANNGDVDGENVEGSEEVAKPGLRARFKNFKKSLKGLSDLQKLILLTIAVVLPAGILIAVALASFLKKRKK
ncbi:hypothetical protein [Fibrobacter sp. UWB11]|uniref:hypothetical protein n=1 Tax=Fibrobacter sp. UWB11 TaxID=1896202 RepID=UPI00092B21B3|nr:hypothetical protein [Fibrobacter sp. UWB11]SIN90152.1 hypothetical protein SAMN05720758_0488 [Fibrobacter sp. UWB11]